MNWRHSIAVFFLLISVQALADIGPPIRIRIIPDNPEVYPQAGMTYTGNLELATDEPSGIVSPVLMSPDIPGEIVGWTVDSFLIPEEVTLAAGDVEKYPFSMTCNDPGQPLELHV